MDRKKKLIKSTLILLFKNPNIYYKERTVNST